MNIQRCFEILELDTDASLEDVKKARKDLIFIWHPDRVSSKNPRLRRKAEEKLKEINAAYESLLSFLSGKRDYREPVKHESDAAPEKTTRSPAPEDSGDEADAYFNQGIAYGEADKHRQAIKSFNRVIRLRPNHADAYYNRGIAYNKAGKYKQAIKDFTQAVRIDPNYAIAYIYRGYIYAELDSFDLACGDFQKACELGNDVGLDWAKKRGFCM